MQVTKVAGRFDEPVARDWAGKYVPIGMAGNLGEILRAGWLVFDREFCPAMQMKEMLGRNGDCDAPSGSRYG